MTLSLGVVQAIEGEALTCIILRGNKTVMMNYTILYYALVNANSNDSDL